MPVLGWVIVGGIGGAVLGHLGFWLYIRWVRRREGW